MTRSQLYRRTIESMSIRTRTLKVIPFRFNEAQEVVWTQYIAPKLDTGESIWLIILKARRLGMSTLIEALLLARVALQDHVHAMVMASKLTNTNEIWKMSETMKKQTPALAATMTQAGKQLQCGQSYLQVATAGTEDATRAFDLTCLHGSEVAFWPSPETMLAALQCLPEQDQVDSWCFLESTANKKVGNGAMFYDEWGRAVAGQSGFTPVFLPWFILPSSRVPGEPVTDLDEEETALINAFALDHAQLRWRRRVIATKCQGSVEKFHQEYPSTPEEAFISSGLPFFTRAQLLPFEASIQPGRKYRIDPSGKLTPDPQGPLTLWQMPEEGHTYGIGADSSMGLTDADRSRSTAEILDWSTLEQVGEYDASTPPHQQAKDLVGMARLYHDALLCPEVQASGGGGGLELLVFIRELDYYHLHGWKHPDAKTPQAHHLVGWQTNSKTRPRMFARIRQGILEKSVTIHSRALLTQLADLGENDDGRLEAIVGHDDLVFAYGIALVSRSENHVATVPEVPSDESPPWKQFGVTVQPGSDHPAAEAWRRHRQQQEQQELTYQEL